MEAEEAEQLKSLQKAAGHFLESLSEAVALAGVSGDSTLGSSQGPSSGTGAGYD